MRLAVVQHPVGASDSDIAARLAQCEGLADACVLPGNEAAARAVGRSGLGEPAVFTGDDCFRPELWRDALARGVTWAVLTPRSENDLQAEAALEVAIALSDALSGLVVIAEECGAQLGEPGHGGSAIIVLGDVVAEAFDGADAIVGEVGVPVPQPEPREALPAVPPILQQRLATHAGQKPGVAYLADLSDGRLAR